MTLFRIPTIDYGGIRTVGGRPMAVGMRYQDCSVWSCASLNTRRNDPGWSWLPRTARSAGCPLRLCECIQL
jgi:hypothetical protein